MPTPPTLSNATAFAARGHGIIFLHGIVDGKCTCGTDCGKNAGKHPHHLSPHGVKNAITDVDKIRKAFAKYPWLNYGVCTDEMPTIDIDPRNGGDKSWRALVRENHDICGWRSHTGGGGVHIMLSGKLPSCVLAQGIELQGAGKYVVGPGCVHKSGGHYTWDKSAMPDGDLPEMAPPWLVQMALAGKAKPGSERTPEEDEAFFDMLVGPALPGERRARVAQLLGHLFGAAFPHRGVLVALVISHVEHVYPDLTDFEKQEIIELARDFIQRDSVKRGLAA